MTIGCKGEKASEMGEMIRAGAVGIADGDLTVENANLMRNIFTYSKMFDVPVVTPVSYTHLDVYKRQIMMSTKRKK